MKRSDKPKKKGAGCLTVIVVLALISNVFNKNESDDPTTNPPSPQDNVSETEDRSQDTNALLETSSPETAAPETAAPEIQVPVTDVPTESEPPIANEALITVYLHLTCRENLIFNQYNLTVLVDGDEIALLEHGATDTIQVQLSAGSHTLQLRNTDDKNVSGETAFFTEAEAEFHYTIRCEGTYVKIEAEVPETEPRQESRTEYISTCGYVEYNSVERNPSNFNGKRIAVTGKVIQVSEGWFDSVTLRVDCNGDVWYVKYTHKDNESRILEDDIITCYGECTGVESYTTILGSTVTIPSMKMQYFDLIEGHMTHPIETVILETKTPETNSLDKTHTIYNQDDITISPIMTGIGNEKIGEYSVLRANSSEVNEDYLTDWYVNHVKKNEYNYCIIIYSDQTSLVGVYATATHILEGCSLWLDDRGDYCLGDSSNATLYFLNENGSLSTLE